MVQSAGPDDASYERSQLDAVAIFQHVGAMRATGLAEPFEVEAEMAADVIRAPAPRTASIGSASPERDS